jgi:dTDP-4-amino-4,6-dideoxygalactose transaminase
MKTRLEDLAIFGGQPAFSAPLHVGRPNIGNRARLLERVNEILDRRWLTNGGPCVREFERRIAELVGVKHCIAISNGTLALEIAIRALGLRGEVIVPAFTFIATAHALQWQGITPIFCDVDPRTYTLDPVDVERRLTPQTTGILGVHLWGRPCAVEALTAIASRHRLKVLFDAAQAFGCSYHGRMIGGFGEAEVFSFHATKFVNTLEGGAVVTQDDDLAANIRLMRNFGFTGYDAVECVGTNGKMNEFCAAMGLTSLDSMDEFLAINGRHYRRYQRELDRLGGIRLLAYDESERCHHQYIVIEVDESTTQISRDHLQRILWADGIFARRYFYPGCHRIEPYRFAIPGLRLPQTEQLVERVLCLPTGNAIGETDIAQICQIIRLVMQNASAVCAKAPMSSLATVG